MLAVELLFPYLLLLSELRELLRSCKRWLDPSPGVGVPDEPVLLKAPLPLAPAVPEAPLVPLELLLPYRLDCRFSEPALQLLPFAGERESSVSRRGPTES